MKSKTPTPSARVRAGRSDTTDMEIPAFLRRIPPNKETEMTPTPAAEPAKRTKRQSAYIAKVVIPLDMANAATLVAAMQAIEGVKTALPADMTASITAVVGTV